MWCALVSTLDGRAKVRMFVPTLHVRRVRFFQVSTFGHEFRVNFNRKTNWAICIPEMNAQRYDHHLQLTRDTLIKKHHNHGSYDLHLAEASEL